MGRKKIDNRIRVLIENCVLTKHRSMFVLVGDKGRDQVVILHHMLSKATVKARPTVLWCYKKDLGFSSHRKKRMKQIQKKVNAGKLNLNENDPFELFVASTSIRYCYYGETHKILGNTYGMCILQDFEALTPNLLARTIETIEGGGMIVFLLKTVTSLRQLYTVSMDVHSRYRTESHQHVVARFNERFILSLASCQNCIVMDDQLNVLPISSHVLNIDALPKSLETEESEGEKELKNLRDNLADTQPIGCLINLCRTHDQGKGLLKFLDCVCEKTLRSTVAMTAARGRGKSACLGLAVAGAVAFGYSNIFVTSPSPENLKTFFEFVFKGFDALKYEEHLDFDIIQSTNPDFNKAVVRVNVFRDHRQTIQYLHPSDSNKLGQAELVVIDEAAAIPLPLVKNMLGPYLVFMASTISGYEGTGRSLALKLIEQLRIQAAPISGSTATTKSTDKKHAKADLITGGSSRMFHELTLTECVRYKPGDVVEGWLNDLLCLDSTSVQPLHSGCPLPQDCDLYYVNRDTLFCYHKASEKFLHRMIALYVSSHYKNSPNDLQMLSDAPAHHLFALLAPVDPDSGVLPEILSVIQVCLEGEISKKSVMKGLSDGKRASGDLIPWTVAQQFQDDDFPSLSGCRVVRIATHPDYQSMGYGSRALELLEKYYDGSMTDLDETKDFPSQEDQSEVVDRFQVDEDSITLLEEKIGPRKNLPPLLLKLSERRPEKLDYLGVSYGLTGPLLKFWKRAEFVPVYLRQTSNELTGEHSCIMLKILNCSEQNSSSWLQEYFGDFQKRFLALCGLAFKEFHPSLSLNIINNKIGDTLPYTDLTKDILLNYLSRYDLKRLDLYSRNMADYHLITDLIPTLAKLYFTRKLGPLQVSAAQAAILVGMGLQLKTADQTASELDLPTTQLLGLFNRMVRKVSGHLNQVMELDLEKAITQTRDDVPMEPVAMTMKEELDRAAKEFEMKQQEELAKLKHVDLSQYSIKGTDLDWSSVLDTVETKIGKHKSLVTIKSEKRAPTSTGDLEGNPHSKRPKKHKLKKRH